MHKSAIYFGSKPTIKNCKFTTEKWKKAISICNPLNYINDPFKLYNLCIKREDFFFNIRKFKPSKDKNTFDEIF